MRNRWTRAAALAAGTVIVLAGCAGVPRSGSVHVGRSITVGVGVEPDDIRVIASAPVPGMTPATLVAGFFNSVVDSDADYHIARLYLAPHTDWHTTTGTTIYGERSFARDGEHGVDVSLHTIGTVDPLGDYRATPAVQHVHFTLVRVAGQWRISHLPNGIFLSNSDADRTLQSASLYFFNRAQTRLVPQPVLLPSDEPGLASTLVRELVDDGPSRALAPAVVTAVPKGTGLVGNVPVDAHGVASVDLAGSVQQIAPGQLERLTAQIAWTLRQLPEVTSLRLLVNGVPLAPTGQAKVQKIGSWPQFDPQTPPTSTGALLTNAGRVVAVSTSVPSSLRHRTVTAAAVSADGTVVAALRPGRRGMTLLVGPADGRLRARWSAAALSAPAFTPDDEVVVVSGSGTRSRLVEVGPRGRTHPVALPAGLRAASLSQVAVSRDGSRIALVVGAPGHRMLVVGSLTKANDGLVVGSVDIVVRGSQDAAGVTWAGANEILTTVRTSRTHRQVLETGVDGYEPVGLPATGLPKDPTDVAGAPGQPVLATAGGEVWMLTGVAWHRLRAGSFPSYAG